MNYDDVLAVVGISFSLLGLFVVFYSISSVCDKYLVPAVEVIIKEFDVPEQVAAVTFLALGDALPEILLNTISSLEGSAGLSLPETLGSALIAFGLIPPLCVAASKYGSLNLLIIPIVRETGFYVIGLAVFLSSMKDGVITGWDAGRQLSLFLLYLGIVLSTHFYCAKPPAHDHKPEDSSTVLVSSASTATESWVMNASSDLPYDSQTVSSNVASSTAYDGLLSRCDETVSIQTSLSFDPPPPPEHLPAVEVTTALRRLGQFNESGSGLNDSIGSSFGDEDVVLEKLIETPYPQDGDNEHDNRPWDQLLCRAITWARHLIHIATCPVDLFLEMLMPSLQSGAAPTASSLLYRTVLTLALCLVLIAMLCSLVVTLALSIVARSGLGVGTLGATLVAFGSELPDMVSSMALARNGYHDGALAGAIASQIVNITLGLALPAALLSLCGAGRDVGMGVGGVVVSGQDSHSLWMLAGLLLVVVGTYIVVTLSPIVDTSLKAIDAVASVLSGRKTSAGAAITCSCEPSSVGTRCQVQLSKASAIVLLIVWGVAYSVFIFNNEQ